MSRRRRGSARNRAGRGVTPEVVDVIANVNGSLWSAEKFWAARVISSQQWEPGGSAMLRFEDGWDREGPVSLVHYRRAEKIVRRPVSDAEFRGLKRGRTIK